MSAAGWALLLLPAPHSAKDSAQGSVDDDAIE